MSRAVDRSRSESPYADPPSSSEYPAIVPTATISPRFALPITTLSAGGVSGTSQGRRDDAPAANSGNNSSNNQLCRYEVLNHGRAQAGWTRWRNAIGTRGV